MQDAYVINLDSRTDRWNQIQKDFGAYPFRLLRYSGVIVTHNSFSRKEQGYIGLALTHQQLVKEARDKGLKTILILEDDCKPEPHFLDHWNRIKGYLDSNLDKWEVFNGGICGVEKVDTIIQLDKTFLVKEKGGCFSHWLYINVETAYDKLMAWDRTKEIDLYYSHYFNHYVSYPLLATQHSGKSDIGSVEKDWSLNFLMAKMDLRSHLMSAISSFII